MREKKNARRSAVVSVLDVDVVDVHVRAPHVDAVCGNIARRRSSDILVIFSNAAGYAIITDMSPVNIASAPIKFVSVVPGNKHVTCTFTKRTARPLPYRPSLFMPKNYIDHEYMGHNYMGVHLHEAHDEAKITYAMTT